MTTALADKPCTRCRGGVPPLAREEAEALRANCKDWELLDEALSQIFAVAEKGLGR